MSTANASELPLESADEDRQRPSVLIAFLIVVASYWLYALVVVPWIERPPAHGSLQIAEPTNQLNQGGPQETLLARLFPQDAWERGSVNQLRTAQLLLLWKRHETVEGTRLRVSPLTMVFREQGWSKREFTADASETGSDADGRVWIVRAPSGAILEFDTGLNLAAGKFGKFQAGFIPGTVSAVGSEPAPASGANPREKDRIEVLTQNLQFDDEHIWTTHAIELHWGQTFVSGRDLMIRLASGLVADERSSANRAPSTIESVRLMHLQRLHLVLPRRSSDHSLIQSAPTPIDVSTEGPLLLNLSQGIAELQQAVRLERLSEEGQLERLLCERLLVYLRQKPPSSARSQATAPSKAPLRTKLDVPGFRPVRVVATGQPVIFESRPAGASPSTTSFRLEAVQVDCDLREPVGKLVTDLANLADTGGTQVGRLPGEVVAQGPGRVVGTLPVPSSTTVDLVRSQTATNDEHQRQVEFAWAGVARWLPAAQQAVLTVEQQARIADSRVGQFSADRCRVLFHRPMRDTLSLPSSAPIPTRSLADWEPGWLEAVGQVHVETNSLRTSTNELHVELLPSTPVQPVAEPRNPNELILGDPNPFVRDAALTDLGGRYGAGPTLDVSCDQVALRIVGAGSPQARVETAVLSGDVRCQELPSTGTATTRFDLRGEFVQLIDLTRRTGRIEVVGQPAAVRLGLVELTGSNVNVDLEKNQAWIDGPGVASLPLPSNVPLAAGPATERATLTWNRAMRFDGRVLDCSDGISIRGPLQLFRAQTLQVELKQPFMLRDAAANGVKPELDSTRLIGDVFLENRNLGDQGIMAIDTARLQQVAIRHLSDTVEGQGPGWVESIRRGKMPLGPPNLSAPSASSDELTYVHVQFQQGISGSLQRREIRFFDQIQAVYGPVPDWSSKIAETERDRLPAAALFLRCRELILLQSPLTLPGAAQFEMIARGNTTVEGREFQATADRLSYDQAKDLLVLEGTHRAGAHIWYQDPQGTKQSEQVARKLEYYPKSNRLKIDGFQFLQFRARVNQ